MKKLLLILALICMIVIPVFSQTGDYTTNEYFYLPEYGAYGTDEYDEYNTYMEIADLQIEANKDAITTKQPLDAGLTSISGLTTSANKSIYTTALDTYGVYSLTAFGRSILDDADEATFKATVNLETGTDIQAYDAGLLSLAGLTYASPSFIKVTANDTYAIRTLAEVKQDLDLEIGTDVQAFDDALTSISGLTYASPSFIKLTANDTYAVRTIAEVITDLALDSDDLSDVASIAMLDEEETVTEVWDFKTTNTYFTRESDSLPFYIQYQRARDGTPTSNVSSGDALTQINFWGYYGEDYYEGAIIRVTVDGTPGAFDMPARIDFFTTPDDWDVPALRLAIDSAGNIKMGDGAWTNYANVDNAGVLTFEGTASINEPLSILAATTSAELRGVISDEIGAGKARFDTSVTTKNGAGAISVAEAGKILVSAGAVYTLTLPTASGNTGLEYHFVKTDANYNLITLDADGAETFNYENSTGTPNLTYLRLNTYCAEVTIVSDGTNWQVIDEAMGQVPMASVYLGSDQENIIENRNIFILFDTETYDIGGNYDISEMVSGTADENTPNHLVDDGESQFTADMVTYRVQNTATLDYAYVISYVDAGDLELSADIFPLGNEAYQIMNSKFVCPVPGYYEIFAKYNWAIVGSGMNDGVEINIKIYKNGNNVGGNSFHTGVADKYITCPASHTLRLAKDDYIQATCKHSNGDNTPDVDGGAPATYMTIKLISKD